MPLLTHFQLSSILFARLGNPQQLNQMESVFLIRLNSKH